MILKSCERTKGLILLAESWQLEGTCLAGRVMADRKDISCWQSHGRQKRHVQLAESWQVERTQLIDRHVSFSPVPVSCTDFPHVPNLLKMEAIHMFEKSINCCKAIYSVLCQKTVFLIVTAVKIPELANINLPNAFSYFTSHTT